SQADQYRTSGEFLLHWSRLHIRFVRCPEFCARRRNLVVLAFDPSLQLYGRWRRTIFEIARTAASATTTATQPYHHSPKLRFADPAPSRNRRGDQLGSRIAIECHRAYDQTSRSIDLETPEEFQEPGSLPLVQALKLLRLLGGAVLVSLNSLL